MLLGVSVCVWCSLRLPMNCGEFGRQFRLFISKQVRFVFFAVCQGCSHLKCLPCHVVHGTSPSIREKFLKNFPTSVPHLVTTFASVLPCLFRTPHHAESGGSVASLYEKVCEKWVMIDSNCRQCRWYILLLFSLLAFQQSLLWITFSPIAESTKVCTQPT